MKTIIIREERVQLEGHESQFACLSFEELMELKINIASLDSVYKSMIMLKGFQGLTEAAKLTLEEGTKTIAEIVEMTVTEILGNYDPEALKSHWDECQKNRFPVALSIWSHDQKMTVQLSSYQNNTVYSISKF